MSKNGWTQVDSYERNYHKIREENLKCFQTTKFEIGKPFGFLWTLKDFNNSVRGKKIVLSPVFRDPNSTHAWRLKLAEESGGRYLNVYLQNEGRQPVRVFVNAFVIDSMHEIKQGCSMNTGYVEVSPGQECGFKSFIDANRMHRFFDHDSALHLYCEIGVEEKIHSSSDVAQIRRAQMRTLPTLDNFDTVLLETRSGVIPAIKNILAARSPVFQTMFSSEHFRESAESKVKIEDFDAEIVQGMLDYVYTGRTESLLKNAADLLQIADKYEILDLKRECEEVVEANLTIYNAAQILIIAKLHSPTNLLPKVVKFLNGFVKDAQE